MTSFLKQQNAEGRRMWERSYHWTSLGPTDISQGISKHRLPKWKVTLWILTINYFFPLPTPVSQTDSLMGNCSRLESLILPPCCGGVQSSILLLFRCPLRASKHAPADLWESLQTMLRSSRNSLTALPKLWPQVTLRGNSSMLAMIEAPVSITPAGLWSS